MQKVKSEGNKPFKGKQSICKKERKYLTFSQWQTKTRAEPPCLSLIPCTQVYNNKQIATWIIKRGSEWTWNKWYNKEFILELFKT